MIDEIHGKYGAKFFYNTHVIKGEHVGATAKPGKAKHQQDNPHLPAPDRAGDSAAVVGALVHSVMCYSLTEAHAPVYGNENLRFMWQALKRHVPVHETWYFPESAYWVTFDNSVPLMLLPYLSARLEDIDSCQSVKAAGHVTFSSGWEWLYWLNDWSIARWSWRITTSDGTSEETWPMQYFAGIFQSDDLDSLMRATRREQDAFLKDTNLLRFVVAQQTLDEVPPKFAKPFEPTPDWRYDWLWKKAPPEKLDSIEDHELPPLLAYHDSTMAKAERTEALYRVLRVARGWDGTVRDTLMNEYLRGLRVNALRAKHRWYTISYLIGERREKLGLLQANERYHADYLLKARDLRFRAQKLVEAQEAIYRYDPDHQNLKRKSKTAYHFGYLYTTLDLHFWKREEEQVRRKRFGPLFMSPYNLPRIIGLW
jgi:hypothetical protein